ncbi:MAG TPA: BLUF domain-containing protein [Myxococcota bacterium]|nr:BLUF domain-containing protein [Myxococcota bacterium]
MLVRLLYASRANGTLDEALVDSIIEQSRRNNPEHGITGILCAYPRNGIFLQVIEGARARVNGLYGNIVRDDRHRDILLLDYSEIEERRFAGWRMGSIDLNKVNLSTILRFSETAALDPYSMTGRAALALVEELASSAAIVSRDGR